MGLSKDSMQSLDQASRGAFLCLSVSEARTILDRIIRKTRYTSNHDQLPKDEKESSPDQEEEVLIAKSQPLQSQDLAINPKPPIPQNPPKEEGIPPLEIPVEIKDDLFGADFGRALILIRDLQANIIEILSRRDLLESVLIPMWDIGKNSSMACLVMP